MEHHAHTTVLQAGVSGRQFLRTVTFKKLPLLQFGCNIKDGSPQLAEKSINIRLLLTTTYLWGTEFCSYTLAKTTYCNRWNTEADV